jgi:hypothetical protein
MRISRMVMVCTPASAPNMLPGRRRIFTAVTD